jgi:hypothetical protein
LRRGASQFFQLYFKHNFPEQRERGQSAGFPRAQRASKVRDVPPLIPFRAPDPNGLWIGLPDRLIKMSGYFRFRSHPRIGITHIWLGQSLPYSIDPLRYGASTRQKMDEKEH